MPSKAGIVKGDTFGLEGFLWSFNVSDSKVSAPPKAEPIITPRREGGIEPMGREASERADLEAATAKWV